MKALFLLLLLLPLSAISQLAPRLELFGTFTSAAQANAAGNVISVKLETLKTNSVEALDRSLTVKTNTGLIVATAVFQFKNTNQMNAAVNWFQTNQFGGNGWQVRIRTHLCPGTNQTPADWLGCALDSRAHAAGIVITP